MRMRSSDAPERVAERLSCLCHRALDLRSFQREAQRILQPVTRHDGACWLSVDPDSLLLTSHVQDAMPVEAKTRELVYEYTVQDYNQIPGLLGDRMADSFTLATGGHLGRSPTFRDVLEPEGFGDSLRGCLVADGACWGGAAFYRRRGQPEFDATHADVLRAASPYLAEGVRRALVLGGKAAVGPAEGGVILLDGACRIESMNAAARELLDQLLFVGTDASDLVLWLANRTRLAVADANAGAARARVPTASGAWLTLRGSILEGGPEPRVAILIEPARDADLLPMALDAYGLTDREREVTALIVRGLSAPAVGRTLFLSPWTVKDHLKAIFDKVGVSSRAELVAAIHLRWALNLGDDSDGLDARQVSRRPSP